MHVPNWANFGELVLNLLPLMLALVSFGAFCLWRNTR
jgi:hypothetical protein